MLETCGPIHHCYDSMSVQELCGCWKAPVKEHSCWMSPGYGTLIGWLSMVRMGCCLMNGWPIRGRCSLRAEDYLLEALFFISNHWVPSSLSSFPQECWSKTQNFARCSLKANATGLWFTLARTIISPAFLHSCLCLSAAMLHFHYCIEEWHLAAHSYTTCQLNEHL